MHQAEFNHTVLHGQKLSVDLAHPNPPPMSRPLVVPKPSVVHPPPASARPSSVMGAKPPVQEPVKVYGGPSAIKRPASATPGGASANRFVQNYKSSLRNEEFRPVLVHYTRKSRMIFIENPSWLLMQRVR